MIDAIRILLSTVSAPKGIGYTMPTQIQARVVMLFAMLNERGEHGWKRGR